MANSHTHDEYTRNKAGEIKALIQWEGIGSWNKFRGNVWGYLVCFSSLCCIPHANANRGRALYPITHRAVNSCFSLTARWMCVCLQGQQVHSSGWTWKNTKTSTCTLVLFPHVGVYISDISSFPANLNNQKNGTKLQSGNFVPQDSPWIPADSHKEKSHRKVAFRPH